MKNKYKSKIVLLILINAILNSILFVIPNSVQASNNKCSG